METVAPRLAIWRQFKAFLGFSPPLTQLQQPPWCLPGEQLQLMSRSAHSLAYIYDLVAALKKKKPTLLVPGFFCNESLAPLRLRQANLQFYPMTEQLQPDFSELEQLVTTHQADLVLIAHTFGNRVAPKQIKQLGRRTGVMVIEDCVHELQRGPGLGEQSDFVLFSPHKWFALAAGALLILRPKARGLSQYSPEQLLGAQARIAPNYSQAAGAPLPWWLRKTLLTWGLVPPRQPRPKSSSTSTAQLAGALPPPRLSAAAQRSLLAELATCSAASKQRQLNSKVLRYLLPAWPQRQPAHKDATDYAIPFDSAAARNDERLQQLDKSPLVFQWPDLPAEVKAQPERYPHSINAAAQCWYHLCHQSLSVADLSRRLDYRQPTDDSSSWRIALTQDGRHYDELFNRVARSNLLQARAYGEAKVSSSRIWRQKLGIIYKNEQPVALFQALLSPIWWGPLRLVRINRGPLWLHDGDAKDHATALKLIRRRFRGRLMIASFELVEKPVFRLLAVTLGFNPLRRGGGWHSSWLDLSRPPEQLRANLHSKWRNQLRSAEAKGLVCRCDSSHQAFSWLLRRYEDFKQQKNFQGPSIELLFQLRQQLRSPEHCLVLNCEHQGQTVAAVLLLLHGTSATYLIGWNNNEGRKTYATNFLLWQAMIILRDKGVRWLDTGGINDAATSSISRFKRGLQGEEYQLIGDYIAFA